MDSQKYPQSRKNINLLSLFYSPANVSTNQEYFEENIKPRSSQYAFSVNPTQINPIYKKVLEFPSGFDHLKYFGYNPHPDKIADEDLIFTRPVTDKDLNIPLAQKQMEFHFAKNKLWLSLSEKERKMLLLPEKLDKFISLVNEPYAKIALRHLRDTFLTYFSTPIDKSVRPDIQWIDFKFATDYEHAQAALEDLEKNLLNTAAKAKLEEKLREAGAFGKEKKDFYFWNVDPYSWPDISYQARSVQHILPKNLPPQHGLPLSQPGVFGLIPQYAALGDFTINAIPEGYVKPKGNGEYEICVKNVYLFVNDVFNFEGNEPLGRWDLNEDKEYDAWGYTPITNLFNSDFQIFKRHGYGPNIQVLSRLHRSTKFKPDCWQVSRVK